MKKHYLIFLLGMMLSGCFSLKTPLPEVSYFDLDLNLNKSQKCQASPYYVGIAEIRSLNIYEDQSLMMKKSSGEVVKVPKMAWIDTPKNLFKKAIIEQFNAQCIKVSLPPFGGIKNDYLLKLEILNFEISQEANEDFVHLGLFYEFLDLKEFRVLESGFIEEKEPSEHYVASFKKAIQSISLRLAQRIKVLQETQER
ncbi:ABC-type transport auxiliary lipoprotein family protein [Helicobacter kayseriensis]|uniref:ABC-type transport auxiliary lipoprotein family protein n=1 Tax=Helicobacter kayseriensis TaxID=2905877 RepID=UPI001E3E7662|nr:hypothetical protein [Helicobacter kayseriensis]MCE3047185.1 hypothetical protein [Helicobacter kayseriensis]MCE3048556.1 hypothetical protein [Helicobacter kayseriensis]